jgi:hypothetical protein
MMVIRKELKGDGYDVFEITTSKCVSLPLNSSFRMKGRIVVSTTETTGEPRGDLSYQ